LFLCIKFIIINVSIVDNRNVSASVTLWY